MSQVITTQPKANIDENGEAQDDQEIEAEKKRKKEEKKSCLYQWCGFLSTSDDPVDVGDDNGSGSNCCCVTGVDNTGDGNNEDNGCDCWGGGCDSRDGGCDGGDGGCDGGDGGCDGGDGGGDSGAYGYDNGDCGCDFGDTGGDSGGGGID